MSGFQVVIKRRLVKYYSFIRPYHYISLNQFNCSLYFLFKLKAVISPLNCLLDLELQNIGLLV